MVSLSLLVLLLLLPFLYLVTIDQISNASLFFKGILFGVTVWSGQRLLKRLFWIRTDSHFFAFSLCIVFSIILYLPTWIEAGLIHFTGKSFSAAFFFHASWESVKIAILTYKVAFIVMFCSLLGAIGILKYDVMNSRPSVRKRGITFFSICGYGLIFIVCMAKMPVGEICKSAYAYYWKDAIHIAATSHDEAVLSQVGIRLITQGKEDVKATLPAFPENLIFIFLESMNLGFVNHPDYPGLTPNLDRFSRRFTALENHISTEGATLPAMISNLCGLFPNYAMGDDTMALRDSMYENVACLTDVLHGAGYYQVYMGGAKSSFAGKGIFLKGHGYDEVMGWEQWKASGKYDNSHSWWGLYDTDLFDEAIKKIRHLSDKEPFHLTLLSLNTHLPGYSSARCSGYPGGEENDLLDAIYCSDAALGKFLDMLEHEGYFETSTIVIVGDHIIFNHENARKILKEKIEDQRILALIHSPGDDLSGIGSGRTAPYDMAATIPDLLGVTHNISFSVGQSLLDPIADHRFLLSHVGISAETKRPGGREKCIPNEVTLPNGPPFTLCEQYRMIKLLNQNLSRFSGKNNSILQTIDHVVMEATIEASGRPRIFLNKKEQLEHMTKKGVKIEPDEDAIYCVVLSSNGEVRLRERYRVDSSSEMKALLFTLHHLKRGEWFFFTHKGDVIGKMPRSVHYLLQRLGWNEPLKKLVGHAVTFIGRVGSDPETALLRYTESMEAGQLVVNFTFSDFKPLIALPRHEASKMEDENKAEVISLMIDDDEQFDLKDFGNIRICGSGAGESAISFFSNRRILKRGINVLVFSDWMQEIAAEANFDFNSEDVNKEGLMWLLTGDTSDYDLMVVLAVDDDVKMKLPDQFLSAFEHWGAKKFSELKEGAPYLIFYHTKHGVIYEMAGEPGECIVEESKEMLKHFLLQRSETNDDQ